MRLKHKLNFPRTVLAVAIGWATIILGWATVLLFWRLTYIPAAAIADLIVPPQESSE